MINYSPWMNFSSRDPNETMLNKYLHAVYTFILAHPGVTWVRGYGCCDCLVNFFLPAGQACGSTSHYPYSVQTQEYLTGQCCIMSMFGTDPEYK